MMPISCALLLAVATFGVGIAVGRRWARKGARSLLPFGLMALTVAPSLAAPPDALADAVLDCRRLDAATAPYVRYLDLSHLPPAAQALRAKGLAWHLNSLSRESDIVVPRPVAAGVLLAIDLRDYGLDPATWEKLADPETKEPYYHVLADVTETYQAAVPAQNYGGALAPPPGYGGYVQPAQPAKTRTVRRSLPAPWLDKGQVDELYSRTKSAVPIVRGDWLYYQTAIQENRHVGYYDWLAVKDLATFQKLGGVNAAEAKRLKLEMAAAVAKSGVAINNRGIIRQRALTGGYWLTQDYETSTDRQNVARLQQGDTEPPQGDATEQYLPLTNGLFAYGLFDKAGARQNKVPQNIAMDNHTAHNDRNIYAGTLSCQRCHVEGLRPIDDWVRNLYSGGIEFKSPLYDRVKRFRQLYGPDLKAQLAADNAGYAAAVQACNGLDVRANAELISRMWDEYAEDDVTRAVAAAELGCTEERLTAAVQLYLRTNPIIDPLISGYGKDPPLALRREHYEEIYPFLQKLVGYR